MQSIVGILTFMSRMKFTKLRMKTANLGSYRDCYYMHSYLMYSICRPLKVIVKRSHKIMQNSLKKLRLTYLPKLKLMDRSMAIKYIFKDGLNSVLVLKKTSRIF